MIATDFFPISVWSDAGSRIGVTWKGRGYSDTNPVLSSYVESAIGDLHDGSIESILRRACGFQSAAAAAAERKRYYDRLPRRGDQWTPNPYGGAETAVWTVRGSNGNHHACDRDITAGFWVRADGGVVPTLRDGLRQSVTETIMVCEAGTRPAAAIRALIRVEREHRSAWLGLAASADRTSR